MLRSRRGSPAPGGASHASTARSAGPGHGAATLQRRAGNQATTALLSRTATAPALLSVGDALDLQRSGGNQAVLSLLQSLRRPAIQRADAAATPADVNVGFNPMDVNHKLLLAIDQSQVDIHKMQRHVNFDAVVAALSNLTAAQVRQVETLYEEHEKRTLYNDLFGAGESGFESDLTLDQVQRIGALLAGTKAEAGMPQAEAQAAAAHKLEADAAELHSLLHGDLEHDEIERVMVLLRRSARENEQLGAAYARVSRDDLRGDLGRLGAIRIGQATMLLLGDPVAADAFDVRTMRARIEGIDARIKELQEEASGVLGDAGAVVEAEALRKERKGLVEDLERRVGGAVAEARHDVIVGGGTAEQAEAAARARGSAVVGDVDQLAAALGGADAALVRAVASDDPVTRVAAELRKSAESGDLSGAQLTAALRGLRDEAHAHAQLELRKGRQDEVAARAEAIAKGYFERLRTTYDDLVGSGQHFDQLVADTGDEGDVLLNQVLVLTQGQPREVDELVLALRGDRKDTATVERVLRDKFPEQIAELKAQYRDRTGKDLDKELFGDAPTHAGEANPEMMGLYQLDQGKAEGTDRLKLEDYLQRPNHEGGLEEALYISARAEREYDYTIEHRGTTGALRDAWGNEQRQLLDETIATVRDLFARYLAGVGWTPGPIMRPEWATTPQAQHIIAEMRLARATIRGDRAAYEKATAELRATFEAVAAFALQIALTAVLGPVAELALIGDIGAEASLALRVAKAAQSAAVGTASTIGANLAVHGSNYSSAMLIADLRGGMGGALGPAALNKLVGPYAKALATQLGSKAPMEILSLAGTVASMETSAWAQGQSADLSLASVATAHAGGKLTHAATEKVKGGLHTEGPPPVTIEEHTTAGPAEPAAAGPEPTALEPTAPEPTAARPEEVVPEEVGAEPAPPRSPGHEFAPEPTQVDATPEGAVMQGEHPSDEYEAWMIYKKLRAADPRREAAMMFNHATQEWAVVQGGRSSVPTIEAMRTLGWEAADTVVGRHSHPIGVAGQTSEANQLASGRGGDIELVRSDSYKGGPAPDAQWHAIDITMAGGKADRTWIFYDRKVGKGRWSVIYPDAGEPGGRGRVSFETMEEYRRWFEDRFGFSPDRAGGPVSAAEPSSPAALGEELDRLQDRVTETLQGHPRASEVYDWIQRAEELLANPDHQDLARRVIEALRVEIDAMEMTPTGGTGLEPGLTNLDPVWEPPPGAAPKPPLDAPAEVRLRWLRERLMMHVDQARERALLTPRQAESVLSGKMHEATHWGTQVDELAKLTVSRDPDLSEVIYTTMCERGPDFVDSIQPDWFDITTWNQWKAHVMTYGKPYGEEHAHLLPSVPYQAPRRRMQYE